MINYLKASFARKKARRVTQKYPTRIDRFPTTTAGEIQFANWLNPLVSEKKIEEENIHFFKNLLPPDAMVIDIGANIGLMSVTLAAALDKKGLVLAFDPNPMVFEVLEQNAGLNQHLASICAFNNAISEEDEAFFYSSSEASFNNGGIAKEKDNRHGKYTLDQKVKGINLEQFLHREFEQDLNRLALIKIDTEGYDKEIIRSIGPLLKQYRPMIITECFGKNSDEAKKEQFRVLDKLGYKLQYFSDFHSQAEIIDIPTEDDMLRWGHFDILARPKD